MEIKNKKNTKQQPSETTKITKKENELNILEPLKKFSKLKNNNTGNRAKVEYIKKENCLNDVNSIFKNESKISLNENLNLDLKHFPSSVRE